MAEPFCRTLLQHELARRCERNPRYSLRAFARMLEVDPGLLSKVLANKRRLTLAMAQHIAQQLELEPATRRRFLLSITGQEQEGGEDAGAGPASAEEQTLIDETQFQIIADLRHYGILELSTTADFKPDARAIAARLGMTAIEAQLAIERLLRLGLLVRDGDQLIKRSASVTTANKNVTTGALRLHQKQVLKLAINALENEPLERRSMTSMTMAVAPGKVPLAKRLIQQFMDDLCEVMQEGELSEVYQLGVSLYPLAKAPSAKSPRPLVPKTSDELEEYDA
jgi:uncharacterized protein (TIGR02147 family)